MTTFTATVRPISASESLIRLVFQPDETVVVKPLTRSIWVIDISGSMHTVIAQLNQACRQVYDAAELKPVVILFDNHAEVRPMGTTWSNIDSRNQTSFSAAFDLLARVLATDPSLRGANVLFLTDGFDNQTTNLDGYIQRTIHPLLAQQELTLHVIGLGENHDVARMSSLVNVAGQHSFQYAPNADALQETILNLAQMSQPTVQLTIEGCSDVLTVAASGDTVEFTLSAPSDTLTVTCLDRTFRVYLIQDDTPLTVLDRLGLLEQHLRRLAKTPTLTGLESFDHRLDEFREAPAAENSLSRRLRVAKYLALKQVVVSLYAVLRGAATTEDRARVLATTHVVRSGRAGLDKTLDARILKQGDLRSEVEAATLKALVALEGQEEPGDANQLSCLLTTLNYWDALLDGTCMCVTLTVKRTPACIAAPAMLQILKINYDTMTLQGFQEALKSQAGDQTTFAQMTSVIQDRVISECNAVFPLAINEAHWSVAREWMRLALGFMVTLDERGFSGDQWSQVPPLILECLARQVREEPTSKAQEIYDYVRQTCLRMTKRDTLEGLLATNRSHLVDLTLNRTVCPNLRVFLGQLAVAGVELSTAEKQCLLLEGWRRAVRADTGLTAAQALDRLAGYLQINYQTDLASWSPPLVARHQSRINWLLTSLGLPESPDFALYEAWALFHSESETATVASSCPSPLVAPTECWAYLSNLCLVDAQQKFQAEYERKMRLGGIDRYMVSQDVVFPEISHLYGQRQLGIFLAKLRANRHVPGALVNPRAKYEYLVSKGWKGCHRNITAFMAQIRFVEGNSAPKL